MPSEVRLIERMGNQLTVVEAARISFGRGAGDEELDRGLIYLLFKLRHHSPLEHVVFRFHIKAPLFVARQHMRHRVGWSYNEISRRYVHTKPEVRFPSERHVPQELRDAIDAAIAVYEKFAKDDRELARYVLPMGVMTEYYATANLRALLHFFDLRRSRHAQLETRKLANRMYDLVFGFEDMRWIKGAYDLYRLDGANRLFVREVGKRCEIDDEELRAIAMEVLNESVED